MWFIAKNTPDEKDYRAQLTKCIEDVGMLAEHARSRSAHEYLIVCLWKCARMLVSGG